MSTSAEELMLQARIDQFSAEIELQKEVLKQLELSRIYVQRQINAIRDPMARLPLELSSEIFVQCLPLELEHRSPKVDGGTAPMLLTNVCHAWAAIAISTPALWAGIHVEHPRVDILAVWLQRAQNHPLSISLHDSFDNDVAAILGQHAKQLKHLRVFEEQLRVDFDTLASLDTFSCLESLMIEAKELDGNMGGSYPGIRGKINGHSFGFNYFNTAGVMGLLRLAPNLTDCTLHNVNLGRAEYTGETFILPKLRNLTLGKYPWSPGFDCSDERLLTHLSLPALETLALPYNLYGISSNDLSLFLKRSSPPLQTFVIGGRTRGLIFTELEGWLRLVPTLTYLDLANLDSRTKYAEEFFPALGDPQLLPILRTLKMRYRPAGITQSAYLELLRALSARRIHLGSFHLKLLDDHERKPPPETCDGFRLLAADGMDVRVADSDDNSFL